MENLAMWCGILGCALSVIAIITIILIKADIKHLLNKDKILFDDNFAMKKQAIENALNIVDEIENFGERILHMPDFQARAKKCYNDLICVCTDMKTVDEFYNLTKNPVTDIMCLQFKLLCRKEIGFGFKNSQVVKQILNKQKQAKQIVPEQSPIQSYEQPKMPIQEPVKPQQPVEAPKPIQPNSQPASARPAAQRQVAPSARPAAAKPTPVRPTPATPAAVKNPNNK